MSADREATIALVRPWGGWLHDEQARLLWDAAAAVGTDRLVVEIGSFHGKSTAVLARAVAAGVEVVAIDPHAGNDRGPGEWHGAAGAGAADHEAFRDHLRAAGVDDRVRHVRRRSQDAHGDVDGTIGALFIDGAHGYGPASDDIRNWGARVGPGGSMLIHDVFNSVFVTLAVFRLLATSGAWRSVGRSRSLAAYRREDVGLVGRLRNLGAHVAGVPFFARNLLLKSLRAMGLEPLGRVLGHRAGDGTF